MVRSVINRHGMEVDFDIDKIKTGIYEAGLKVGWEDEDLLDEITSDIQSHINTEFYRKDIDVDTIQDIVEVFLIEYGLADTAKEYILYRAGRNKVRNMSAALMKVYEEITFTDASESDSKRENANIDANTAMGSMLKYGTEGAKQFNHVHVLDPEFSKAHKEGDIHIHDLDFYTLTLTCTQIDLEKLFKGGFSTGHGFLREPQDIRSYSALACIAIQSNQNDMHGGQSVPALDHYLAPGVAKTFIREAAKIADIKYDVSDKEFLSELKEYISENRLILNEAGRFYFNILASKYGLSSEDIDRVWNRALKETERASFQAMEGFIHNLNTMHSRAGGKQNTRPYYGKP